MYNLTIHFGPNAVAWSFLFKDEKKAEEAYKKVVQCIKDGTFVVIEDEFGQKSMMQNINGFLLENTELGTEARILRGLDQARGQARANVRAKSDPELARMAQGGGPSVITPFSNGSFRQ